MTVNASKISKRTLQDNRSCDESNNDLRYIMINTNKIHDE